MTEENNKEEQNTEKSQDEITQTAEETLETKTEKEGTSAEAEAETKVEETEAPAEAEEKEKAKKSTREKEAEEEEIVLERIYTVPLGKAWIMPPRKRTPRAMRMLRAFVTKHMKLEAKKEGEEDGEEPATLVITSEVNEKLWERGIEKPPRKIRIRATKDDEGNVTVHLAEGD